MLASAEVRWFWRERAPTPLESWFRSGAFPPGGGTPRDDEYLVDPGQVELGLKKRGGEAGIEIKGLIDVRAQLPGPFPGRVQIWGKWRSHALIIDHLPRIRVRKTRWLRKYDAIGSKIQELALDASERPVDSRAKLPERGCNLELVKLAVGDDRSCWWTFAFEAFGPIDSVERTLERTVACSGRRNPPALEEGSEWAYPQWLSTLAAHP